MLVLADRSASMGLKGRTRPIDRALAEARAHPPRRGPARERLPRRSPRSTGTLHTAREIRRSSDAQARTLRRQGTNYSSGDGLSARPLRSRAGRRPKELHEILTDLQRARARSRRDRLLPDDVDVHLTDLGQGVSEEPCRHIRDCDRRRWAVLVRRRWSPPSSSTHSAAAGRLPDSRQASHRRQPVAQCAILEKTDRPRRSTRRACPSNSRSRL